MSKKILSAMLVTLLVFAMTDAMAKKLSVEPLDFIVAEEISPGSPGRQACYVGNLNSAAWAIGGWMAAPETYMLAFDPSTTCSDCVLGWQLTSVHILLQTDAACELTMRVDLEGADYLPGTDCTYPGPEVCLSELYTINIPNAGLWDIGLPIDCECAYFDYEYLLSVHVESMSCTPDLVTDDFPTDCTSWNDYGSGPFDLVFNYSFPGNLMIWGEVECCDNPVTNEARTWGGVKGLYR